MDVDTASCSSCHTPTQSDWYYCPSCGKTLKIKPIIVSFPKQLVVYLVSFFFAPFGLIWAFPYIRNPNKRTRVVGIIIILLTTLALSITIFTFGRIMNEYSRTLNSIGTGRYPY